MKTWKVISCLALLAVAVSPILIQEVTHLWPLSVLSVVYFWPSVVIVIYRMIKQREVAIIVGGPSFLRPWRRHDTPVDRFELQRRNAPWN